MRKNRKVKKNLLFVVPTWSLGGTEKVNVTVAEKLAEHNTVSLYTLCTPDKSIYPVNNAELYGEWTSSFRFFIRLSGLLGLLHLDTLNRSLLKNKAKRITRFSQKNNIDTIIVSGSSIYLIPFLKAQNPDKKVIAWCHFSASIYLGGYLRYTTSFWVKGLAAADEVICLTEEDKNKFLEINKRVQVINNPITIDNDEVSGLEEKVISWTGRIANPQKGIDYLAKVSAQLPQGWKISIAGDGDMELMKNLLQHYGAEDKVILHGALAGQDLKQHYLNSSIYLMTSRFEGFGLVLVEAMSFGLPIVAFNQTGSNHVLDGGRYGILVENGNVNQMVEKLQSLITDFDTRKMYQEKSLDRVKTFSLDKVVRSWENIL